MTDSATIPSYRVDPGDPLDLSQIDPGDSGPYTSSQAADADLQHNRRRLEELQGRLYAEHEQSLLVVLQALDAGGKDGAIKHVFEGVNPQGAYVHAFKQPTPEELDHDFLWRYHQHTPSRGMIGIFNRSYYEEVLAVRVRRLVPAAVWQSRYESINNFERLLKDSRTTILKFYLHISREEQKQRFESRLTEPDKRWKFNMGDLADRALWDDYMSAFQDAIGRCSTDLAPWYVVPANHKWYRNLVVASTIVQTLERMDPRFPAPQEGLDEVAIPD